MKSNLLILLTVAISFFSCSDGRNERAEARTNQLWQYIIDSTCILSHLEHMEINDSVEGVKYYSVSKESFFESFKRNYRDIRVFDKKSNFNENLENELVSRDKYSLKIKTKNGYKEFRDVKEDSINRRRSFFYYEMLGNYHIIKTFHFEDASTFVLNGNTGTVDLTIPTLNVFMLKEDSLLFISDSWNTVVSNKASNYFIHIGNNKIDTIVNMNTNWFTNFAFFDNAEKSIYFIYEFYDQNKIHSCYAKMEYEFTK